MFHLKVIPSKQHIENYVEKRHLHSEVTPERAIETFEFLRSASTLIRELEANFKQYDLSLLRFLILVVLDAEVEEGSTEECKLTFTEIHDEFDVSKAVMSRTLKTLAESELVRTLESEDDKRLKYYQITQAGIDKLEETFPSYLTILTEFEKIHFEDHSECVHK